MKSLNMVHYALVSKLPSNPNLFYTINAFYTNGDPQTTHSRVLPQGTKADRILVFCNSYHDVLSLYQTMVLGHDSKDALYVGRKSRTSENQPCDKYDTYTALSVRILFLRSWI